MIKSANLTRIAGQNGAHIAEYPLGIGHCGGYTERGDSGEIRVGPEELHTVGDRVFGGKTLLRSHTGRTSALQHDNVQGKRSTASGRSRQR